MSANEFEMLVSQIQEEQLEKLDLGGSKLGEERIGELVKGLKRNKSVKEVSLRSCKLGPTFGAVLCDVLKVNTSVASVDLWGNNLGPAGARAIAEALKVNQTVEVLAFSGNNLYTKGTQAFGEALKVNFRLKKLYLYGNDFSAEGTRALLDALQLNGSVTECLVDELQDDVNALCERNVAMHERAAESVVHLLALRRTGRIVWIPKEITLMIAKALWRTKIDLDIWM